MSHPDNAEGTCPHCGAKRASSYAAALARRRTGCKERKSAVKSEGARKAALIGSAVVRGDLAEADRLRELYFPATMKRKRLLAEVGLDRT